MTVDFTEGALPYVEQLDWKVLLLSPGWKLPFIAKADGGNGVYDASSDADQIWEWGRLCPNGNIGLACGVASGIIAVDVDPRNAGDASLAALAAKGRVLPHGPKQRTGNGGWHFILRWEPGITGSAGKLGDGIEIKSTGGYIVAATSWTRKSDNGPGGFYEWIVSPFETSIPRAPLWLQAMLKPKPRPKIESRGMGSNSNIEGLIRRVASEPEGNRNPMLYWATCRAEENGSATGTNIGRLVAAACHAGLTQSEAMKTVNSAIARVRNERGAR